VLLRGIRAHALASLATLVVALVVSGGAVGVVGAARVGGTPGAVAAMLALYGAVALAEQSARTVVDRSHDIALARLRGLHGGRLVLFAAAPLLTVSLVGIAVGSAVGTWVAGRIAHHWGVAYSLGTREVLVAVAILAGAWLTIVLVSATVIRRPLVDALSTQPRRRTSHWIVTFLELLVIAGAVLAVYEAHRSEADWVPTIAPALVALAAGQLVMWLLALTPRLGRRLGVSLTSRRLRRDPDPGSAVRVLVAAAVLLAVTLTGGRAAADWRDDAGRLQAGGPLVVPVQGGALRAYAAAHDADPDGRWLMAAVSVNDLSPTDRRVYVESGRWDAVVGDFVAGTSVAAAGSHMSTLADQKQPIVLRGDTLTAEIGSVGGASGQIVLTYLSDKGFLQKSTIAVTAAGEATGPLRSCEVGCAVVTVALDGGGFDLDRLSAGPTHVLGHTSYAGGATQTVLDETQGAAPAAALVTSDLASSDSIPGVDGKDVPMRVVGRVGAVPFVGRSGALLDLGRVLLGAVGTVASARPTVVARADTPTSVLARLSQDGGGTPRPYAAVGSRLTATPEARADSLALLVAIGVALVALTHLLAWLAGQTARRRAETAGLRVAGITPRTVRRAYATEAAILAAIVLVTSAIAAAATTVPLLRPMPLVGGWSQAPHLRLAIRPATLAVVVVGVALVTAVLCLLAFTRFGRAARPSALRSAER
jgi:hypothetical protein